jgi:hypothetical protein
MMAIKSDPKASEPRWYLKALKKDLVTGMEAWDCLKYQMTAVEAKTNWTCAPKKAFHQSPMKT